MPTAAAIVNFSLNYVMHCTRLCRSLVPYIVVAVNVQTSDSVVRLPDGETFVRTWTSHSFELTPIVLLHDSLGCVEMWRDFPAALAVATQRPVIAYDRLGFGKSSPQPLPATPQFIDDEALVTLPAVTAALNLKRYVLFGHSVGGGMALAAASIPGNDCVAVVTESAQAFIEERTLDGIRAAKQAFATEVQFEKLFRWHGERARWVLDAWTEVWLSPKFRGWSLDRYLGKITCPVLAIHGDSDEFGSTEFPRHIAQGVRGPARMEVLVACGHVPHREREADVIALVREFLSENRVP